MSRSILVTGGAGYIGSHTCSKLIAAGFEVVVFDNLSTGFKEALMPGARFVVGDIRDTETLHKTMQDHNIESVIHFAAKLNVKESTEQPLDYYDNNVGGVISLLKAAQKAQIKNIVFSSTCSQYGDLTQENPIKETDPKAPLNPYAFSKNFCEQIIRDESSATPLKHVFLRYFNVAGADSSGLNGQRTANAYHLVHLAAQAALGKKEQLTVFGTDYPTPDGTCVRDYIHVEDLANIHVLALNYLLAGGTSDEFNCGYGVGYSVKEVIEAMKKVTGSSFKVLESGRRPGDPASLVANSEKLKNILKWKPQFQDISLICKSAYDWEKKV